MSASLVALTRPPKINIKGVKNHIENGQLATSASNLELSDKNLALWIDFIEQANYMSPSEIELLILSKKKEAVMIFMKESVESIVRDMKTEWSRLVTPDIYYPEWEMRFEEKLEVDTPAEFGMLLYTDTPYCWKIPINNLPTDLKRIFVSLAEKATNLIQNVSSLSMSEFMGFGSGIIDEMKSIDKAGLLNKSLDEALTVKREMGEIEEYLGYRFCDDEDGDGWEHLQKMYNEIKNVKAQRIDCINELKKACIEYCANDNTYTKSLLSIVDLIGDSEATLKSLNSPVVFESLEEEWFEDEIYLGDMALSSITYFNLEFDDEFEQDVQHNWENGAVFGGFVSLETNTPIDIRKRLQGITVGATVLTMLELLAEQVLYGDRKKLINSL